MVSVRLHFVPLLLTAVSIVGGCASSRDTTSDPSKGGTPTSSAPRSDPGLRSFRDVITDAAQSDTGLFTVHMVGEKIFYEIPDSLLGREMLWISGIARAPMEINAFLPGGVKTNEQLVRWDRVRNQVLLRGLPTGYIADDSLPVARAVRNSSFEPIIQSFKVESLGSDSGGVVIEVTGLFTKDLPATTPFSAGLRKQLEIGALDASRSYVVGARSFPMNIEVRHTLTHSSTSPQTAGTGTISVEMNQSLVLLPLEPMRPRLADERVGWFTVEQIDFGLEEQKAAVRRFIRRWRLEPTDTAAYLRGELVEPVKPIVFYIDPATPANWRPWFRKGVEAWNSAFEAAGFRNAIVAKDPPTPEEDPEFDLDDVRYSSIRYIAGTTRNAFGPSVVDPRTGEIIESDIIWYHNHMRSYRNRYIIETGAANPKARSLKLAEEDLGEMMEAVITHEVGHALGFPHNMLSSSAYPVDSLRSASFSQRMGLSPSIMDYARVNYVAQPEDAGVRFIRRLGPYDIYATNWGYRVLLDAGTPEAEKPVLEKWIRERADDPVYRFGDRVGIDPRAQMEDLGNNPLRASRYGIANLKRVLPQLISWTSVDGNSYEDLDELYGELVGQWNVYISHVTTLVGGVEGTTRMSDQPGPVYTLTPAAAQREAVDFLIEQAFVTPSWLVDENILARIEGTGFVERIRGMQALHLSRLLDPERLGRVIESEVRLGKDAYRLVDLLADLRRGIWSEPAGAPVVDTYRRNLQRAYLERVAYLMSIEGRKGMNGDLAVNVSQSDIQPMLRAELVALKSELRGAAGRTRDTATRAHYDDLIVRIERILDPPN